MHFGLLPTLGAGVAAGVASGAVAVAAGLALYSFARPQVASPAGSAFVACLAGAVEYACLARRTVRAGLWLWATALAAATGMSLVEVFLPAAKYSPPGGLRYVAGLLEPAAQLVAMVRSVASGRNHPTFWIRGRFLRTAIVMHFAVAVVAAALIPAICDAIHTMRSGPSVPGDGRAGPRQRG